MQLRLLKLQRQQFGRKSARSSADQLALLLGQYPKPTYGTAADSATVPPAPSVCDDGERPCPDAELRKQGHGCRPIPPELPREVRTMSRPRPNACASGAARRR
ncbi:hypothetical protein [Vulgatibacter incomptus]|uniref:IS66 family transposase n=1 Tax=Vulgatibacter incomptus TaxID=1391653 RepID=UPI0009E92CA6